MAPPSLPLSQSVQTNVLTHHRVLGGATPDHQSGWGVGRIFYKNFGRSAISTTNLP